VKGKTYNGVIFFSLRFFASRNEQRRTDTLSQEICIYIYIFVIGLSLAEFGMRET
jgi:hypothetical protein